MLRMMNKDVWNILDMMKNQNMNRTIHENKHHNKKMMQGAASLVLEADGDDVRELVLRDHVVELLDALTG